MTAFRIITGLTLLVLLYAGFEWGRLAWQAHDAYTPAAEFMVLEKNKGPSVTAYIDYRCGNCAAVYKAFEDVRELHPDVTLIVRPLYFIDAQSETLTRLALAAGLEGKFEDVNAAFMEAKGDISERFLRETLSLYGMDYEELMAKGRSPAVDDLMRDNSEDAQWIGVASVPSLVINRAYYPIPAPLEEFSVSHILPLLAQGR